GILPLADLFERAREVYGQAAWWRLPTLFWFDTSDLALQGVTWLGCVAAVLLLLGVWQRWMLILLFVLYLSFYHAGQTFLSFQWDTLLLETGFLAIFLVNGPTRLLILLFHWLLFRFRFMSGITKLVSGDPSWSSLTTLNYYFETQPLPHVLAWYAHQLPEWLLKGGVLLTFFSELVVPFFIFLPRPFRLFAAGVTIVMQVLIIATSNHNFVNLLTILLCLFLLDDAIVRRIVPARLQSAIPAATRPGWLPALVLPVAGILILVTSVTVYYAFVTRTKFPDPLHTATQVVRAYGIGHIYHIFPTMQTERQELQVEGSHDGVDWQAYTFRYKPGPLDRPPQFIVPHQPRLDWMIWFIPPQIPRQMYWFENFLARLHEGSAEVTALLEQNPFADQPPRYLRVLAWRYRFTTAAERAETGNWWQREYLGVFPYVTPRRP
ncbi:MAG: lipase maturation factor family protein, partial [Gammaproteobacteria bacterium]